MPGPLPESIEHARTAMAQALMKIRAADSKVPPTA